MKANVGFYILVALFFALQLALAVSLLNDYSISPLGGGLSGGYIADNSTTTLVNVGTSSTTLLSANSVRHGVVFTIRYNSTSTVWITCSNVGATVGQGIQLVASSSPRYEQSGDFVLTCPWKAISDNASTPVGVFEY